MASTAEFCEDRTFEFICILLRTFCTLEIVSFDTKKICVCFVFGRVLGPPRRVYAIRV